MSPDDDLARLLPEAPPPRPGRREEAIATAMRRFDGDSSIAPVAPGKVPRSALPWWRMPTAQVGALASVVMVSVIGLSIALRAPIASLPGSGVSTTASSSAAPPASSRAASRDPSAGAATACAAGDCASSRKPAASKVAAPALAQPESVSDRPSDKSSAPAPSDDAPKSREIASEALSRPAPAPPPAVPPAPAPVPEAVRPPAAPAVADSLWSARANGGSARGPDADSDGGNDIVVTGSLVRRDRAASQRGDWNACTVNDPKRTLRGCSGLVKKQAKGAAGEAAVKLSDGLSAAWRGDRDEAIAAFDKAIELNPRFAFAYLNRGLAYQQEGDFQRAAADLDLAVKYGPGEARNYYSRGMLRKMQGDKRGANRDLARAVDLDAEYGDVIE